MFASLTPTASPWLKTTSVADHGTHLFKLSVLLAKKGALRTYVPCGLCSAHGAEAWLGALWGWWWFPGSRPWIWGKGVGSRRGKGMGKLGGIGEKWAKGMSVANLTCIIRRAPFLPSLGTVLLVWVCALKAQLSQVVRKVSSTEGLQLTKSFSLRGSCHSQVISF